MNIELSAYEKDFVIELLQHTTVQSILDQLMSSATPHPDNEDYIECELTIPEIEDLIGELSYEANHNRKKWVAAEACDIAECLEHQLWSAAK